MIRTHDLYDTGAVLYHLGAAYVRNIPLDDEEWKLIFLLYFHRSIHAFWSEKY